MADILIIDDSPTDVRVLTALLERAGHQVASVGNAEEGIERVRSTPPPALVIMDVIMPGMNGFQATRTLTRDPATAEVPIVMITTKAMETDRVWGLRQGARAFITKPVNEGELLACINQLLSSAA
ncbi:response regulator [Rhodanobacter sp. DHG33]|uniref:response regulator n=1 Tax=Rhodanobacter sp. DHG33 TaxID=2775921 RepID=UPI00177B1931|nr:response regulator [Rhodanobacter sp. DHG33]